MIQVLHLSFFHHPRPCFHRETYKLKVVKLVFAGGPRIAAPLGPSSLESGQKVTV